MVEYTTRSEMRGYGSDLQQVEYAHLQKSATDREPTGSTFLSHSSKDGDLIVGAIRILRNHGADVYVDELDSSMPEDTNAETARILKRRISNCRKFVLLASDNSKSSKWVPWELGVADGYKTPWNIALFPALENKYDTSWTEQEYLGLYDRIVWGRIEGEEKDRWIVLNVEKFSAVHLTTWLNR